MKLDAETELKLVRESWRNAVALIKLIRQHDRQGAMTLAGHLEFQELEYLVGSLAAVANSTLEMAARQARSNGYEIDLNEYLNGMITGLAMMDAENDDNQNGTAKDR
jgi:hypothetical protein